MRILFITIQWHVSIFDVLKNEWILGESTSLAYLAVVKLGKFGYPMNEEDYLYMYIFKKKKVQVSAAHVTETLQG